MHFATVKISIGLIRKPKRHTYCRKQTFLENRQVLLVKKNSSSWKNKSHWGRKQVFIINCEVVQELRKFFANVIKNLNIPNYENWYFLAEKIDGFTLKAIAKSRNHPSILAATSEYTNRANLFLKKTFWKK